MKNWYVIQIEFVNPFILKYLFTCIYLLLLAACAPQEIAPVTSQKKLSLDDTRVLILVDGKQVSTQTLQALDPGQIMSIEVIKNSDDVRKYTSAPYEGVVKINLKQ